MGGRRTLTTLLLAAALASGAAAADPARSGEVVGTWVYLVDHVTDVADGAEVSLWAQLPGDQPTQKVKILNIHPSPEAISEDPVSGAAVVLWRLRPEPGDGRLMVRVDFRARLRDADVEIDPRRIAPYDTSSGLYRDYVKGGPWLETSGVVAVRAREIVGRETDPDKRARLLFDWLVEEMTFVPGGTEDQSATATAISRRGDCGQYSRLFAAMCRSLGIPARTGTAAWLDGSRHRFAEFWLPPFGWVPVDPSSAQALTPGRSILDETDRKVFRYLRGVPKDASPSWFFGHLCRNQVIVAIGNNVALPEAREGEPTACVVMEPGGDAARPPAVRIVGLNDDVVHGGFYVFGDAPPTPEEAMDVAYQALAPDYFRLGVVDATPRNCFLARERSTDGATTWLNLGRVHLRMGDYDLAEACLLRALNQPTVDSGDADVRTLWIRNFLGVCYDLSGRRKLALEQYRAVAGVGPDGDEQALAFARLHVSQPFTAEDFPR